MMPGSFSLLSPGSEVVHVHEGKALISRVLPGSFMRLWTWDEDVSLIEHTLPSDVCSEAVGRWGGEMEKMG